MRAWRVKLVATGNRRISWTASAARFLVAWISAGVLGIGFLWSLFEPQRRTWHDMASASRLVVVPRERKNRTTQ